MQQFIKTKYTLSIHKKAANMELLSHFINFLKAKYNG